MRAVVIVANGWNAGWLGCYGNEWVMTPHVDRLAAEGVVFDQHYAASPSSPSVTSEQLLSFRDYGVKTVRVHNLAENRLGDAAGWDETIRVAASEDRSPGRTLIASAKKKLRELAPTDQWFLSIETDRLVPPWSLSLDYYDKYSDDVTPDEEGDLPPPWDEPPSGKVNLSDHDVERLQATFGAVVTEWDAEIGEFLKQFRQLGLDESALLAVTSRHGLSLGEHGWIGAEGERLYEEVIHLPMILQFPKAEHAGRRVPHLTSSADLPDALLDLFRVPPSGKFESSPILDLARGLPKPGYPVILIRWHLGGRVEIAFRYPTVSCLFSVGPEGLAPAKLFHKPEDRWEVNDLRQRHIDWAEHQEAKLRELMATSRGESDWLDRPELIPLSGPTTEETDEHSSTGQRDDGPPPGEAGLRGHQGNEED